MKKVLAKDLKKGDRLEVVGGGYRVVKSVVTDDKSNTTIFFNIGRVFHCFADDNFIVLSKNECLRKSLNEYKSSVVN